MQYSTASIKRLCATFSAADIQKHDGIVKVECYDAPIILTREQTKVFLHEHIFDGHCVDPNIVDSIASQSDLLLVARSDLFGQIDAPYNFGYLHSIYKRFLQDLIIESNWDGLILSDNCVAISNTYVILVKKMNCPSLDFLRSTLKQTGSSNFAMKKIIDIGDDIENVVKNIYEENFGKFYNAPANGSPIKIEEDTVPLKCEEVMCYQDDMTE